MTRVLLVDQDHKLCHFLEERLSREGAILDFAHDGTSGLRSALSGRYQVVILNTRLPDLNGLQVARQLRVHSGIGVLMLGAPGEDVDKMAALECGADDYVEKPFSPRELVARIRAITRRVTQPFSEGFAPAPMCFEIGDLALDEGSRTLRRNDCVVELTTVEFDLLSLFLRCRGHVIHRKELSRKVLRREYSPFDRSIDVHVSNLRRKLGALPDGTERIRSVRCVGYIYAHSPHLFGVSPASSTHFDSLGNFSSATPTT